MTRHYHQDYQCVKCDTFFLPYQSPVTLCPECGEPNLQSEEFRGIVKLLVEVNADHRKQYGHFTPPAYGVFSLVDHYIYYSANIFDIYLEKQTPKALLIEEMLQGESDSWRDHLRELLYLIFEESERQDLFAQQEEAPEEQSAGGEEAVG